jgi:ABC-type transport system involved in cytochrome c biogenesis ATPase subunit
VTGDDVGGGPVLVLRADRLRAARRVLVARRVLLSAAAGDVVAVEGANGSGKSTLLAPRRASGLRRIYHGAAHRARLLTVSQWFAAPG